MNRINFTAKDNFPLSSDTMTLMQRMIALSANSALLGGENYILSGCTDNGATVGDGIIVINGELLVFEGGLKKTKITITQTPQTLHAFGVDYPEAYIFRLAEFSDTGEYKWADFKQVLTNKQIEDRLNSLDPIPKGAIVIWSGNPDLIPSGWALCDGSNGTPNLSGCFIVGFNRQDSDYDEIGKTGGEKKHLLTVSEMPRHSHSYTGAIFKSGTIPNSPNYQVSDVEAALQTGTEGGGISHENRPPYYTLAYIIKIT